MTDAPAGGDAAMLAATLAGDGFCFVPGRSMRPLLEAYGPLDEWASFADSWNRLHEDRYLAQSARYRRRRHGRFACLPDGSIQPLPSAPHYQALEHNPLQGGIDRWFEPLEPSVVASPCLHAILSFATTFFALQSPAPPAWRIEVHQFRIEARPGLAGQPTPEGVHRDGVDDVLVLMIDRHNIASGTTTIHAPDGRLLGSFTLRECFDAALVDDHRVLHGVTPVEPLDVGEPAYRDVLVVTLVRVPGEQAGHHDGGRRDPA